MAVSPMSNTRVTGSGPRDAEPMKSGEKTGQQAQPAEFAVARDELKARANQSLVKAMFEAGGQGDDKAMRIFYGEVLDKLNAELGTEQAVRQEKVVAQKEDFWSPENTADRIVNSALGHFETFKTQNPDMAEQEQLEQFLTKITEAIDKGYGEAVKVLDGLKVFDGGIRDNAEATQALIGERLAAFREEKQGKQE
ncbi:DUF5610 domain-containing protein [uncultured Oceanisphaera sp.]|uniref:DUF5610 domain-containing protein n=1 Tax=uncultured Oceanisphaera sp. TaxID=353858 RepID=UPI002620B4BA|nr:DUF5610 domain-containing protein [uncultured Oceanisphaera sp.]